ncbi:LOW QUALITY PROTEIN: hypothetical protein U9M48_042003 [Paspalum notatum var. saurae]|uniref:Uncharacterized protein n=1 Tax=Paspalum notatum var. saurae TaxID=547442 RepID=A0AAQ3URR0_PASNO
MEMTQRLQGSEFTNLHKQLSYWPSRAELDDDDPVSLSHCSPEVGADEGSVQEASKFSSLGWHATVDYLFYQSLAVARIGACVATTGRIEALRVEALVPVSIGKISEAPTNGYCGKKRGQEKLRYPWHRFLQLRRPMAATPPAEGSGRRHPIYNFPEDLRTRCRRLDASTGRSCRRRTPAPPHRGAFATDAAFGARAAGAASHRGRLPSRAASSGFRAGHPSRRLARPRHLDSLMEHP